MLNVLTFGPKSDEEKHWKSLYHFIQCLLAGILTEMTVCLEKTGLLRRIGRENVFIEGEIIGHSALAAWEQAENGTF